MPLTSAGLCLFAWDFADEGADDLIARIADLGITRLYPAAVYHAGYFLHPHSPTKKMRYLDDGVSYYHPDLSCYADTPLKPIPAPMCAQTDWLDVICDKANRAGLEVAAWTVFFHNTRLGLMHPQCTIINAFGDSYPHALSPGHPDVRAYGRAIMADLTTRYPLHSVMLEAADYRGRKHGGSWVAGHHHERLGTHLRDLEERLMNVSFNPADVAAAESAGIDMTALRQTIRDHMEHYFAAAPDFPDDLPADVAAFTADHPALAHHQNVCDEHVKSLSREMHAIAAASDVTLLGPPDPSFDTVMAGAYGEPPDRVATLTAAAHAAKLDHQQLSVFIRLGYNGTDPGLGTAIRTESDMCAVTQSAADNGADQIVYYNYSEAPQRSSDWIKPALQHVGFTRPGQP